MQKHAHAQTPKPVSIQNSVTSCLQIENETGTTITSPIRVQLKEKSHLKWQHTFRNGKYCSMPSKKLSDRIEPIVWRHQAVDNDCVQYFTTVHMLVIIHCRSMVTFQAAPFSTITFNVCTNKHSLTMQLSAPICINSFFRLQLIYIKVYQSLSLVWNVLRKMCLLFADECVCR